MQRTTRTTTTKTKPTPDDLAHQLSSVLTISNGKGKQKASATTEDRRLSAMRAVNIASHNLSSIIQSASKAKSSQGAPKDISKNHLNELVASAAISLRELRALCPGYVDVERAASSIVGKLIALELFDAGLLALAEMRPCLCSLYSEQTTMTNSPDRLHLLSLPLPPSDSSIDPIVLTLISTYLLHSLTLLCHAIFSSTKPSKDTPNDLANALIYAPTLVTWIPLTASLSVKHQDAVLTRAYTVLTASVSGFSPSRTQPRAAAALFSIRAYSLTCLLHTSPRTIEPDTLWDQAIKFGGTFVKSAGSVSNQIPDVEATRIVLSNFADLVRVARGRVGEAFLKGRGFVRFCEYWMGFAKRAGDVYVLDQVAELMESAVVSGLASTPEHEVVGRGKDNDKGKEKTSVKEQDALLVDGTRICAALGQATALLERELTPSPGSDNDDMVKRVNGATTILRNSKLITENRSHGGADPDPQLVAGKVGRALERMRRVAVKVLDVGAKGSEAGRDSVRMLLVAIVDALQHDIAQKTTDPDATTSALDTLFVLARTSLDTSNAKTYSVAYDFLSRAAKLLEIEGGQDEITTQQANFARCVSGAFHHLAATTYQAGRHAPAVKFLKEACVLGERALVVYRGRRGSVGEKESVEECWRLLEEQLYRRWELLGVCYSKMGERKLAYESFVRSVQAFPYSGMGFLQHAATAGLEVVFSASSDLKQLGTIVHRLTYLGACELLLAPTEVSLKRLVEMAGPIITGVLVEQQLESLEGNFRKEGVRDIFRGLLTDALEVYTGEDMPLRKARVWLRCLNFAYHVGPEGVGVVAGLGSPLEMGLEAARLLKSDVLGKDAGLARFTPQYRASTHLWLALHTHRRADPDQITLVTHHVEEACKVLKLLTAPPTLMAETTGKSKSSLKQTTAAKKGTGKALAVRRVAALKKVTRNVNKEPVTPPKRKALETMSTNVIPPRPAGGDKTSAVSFDYFDKLRSLLQMVASLLGLLGLVLPKISLLDITRHLCERQADRLDDGYVVASVDLAHECLKLGKNKRASEIYGQALNAVGSGQISDEVCARFFLRYAESLASVDNILRSSSVYCEALGLSNTLPDEEKGMSTSQKVRARAGRLERAAMASHVFAMIQCSKEDITTSLDGMLQSLRLWNRAVDTLSRLTPPLPSPNPAPDSDPFAISDPKDALQSRGPETSRTEQSVPKKVYIRRPALDGLEWRIAEGLLSTLFSLCQAYFARGSSREAEYFAQQAQDLAESLNAPAMASRALAKKGEVQLHQGLLKEGYENLMRAADVLQGMPGTDAADIHRLRGDYSQRTAQKEDARQLYQEADSMLEKLNQMFGTFDGLVTRKSTGLPTMANFTKETLVPPLLAAVLRQRIWLLRDDVGEGSKTLLDRFLTLPPSFQTKVEENALMAKLTLHNVYERFHADIFLSSLAESTIALPMGMSGDEVISMSSSTQEILATLDNAEKLYWTGLALISRRGGVPHVRDTAVSLALIRALQTSLGKSGKEGPMLTASLLDASSAITLRREMLETIQHKFLDFQTFDDLQWPLITANGSPLPRPKNRLHARFDASMDSDDEGLPRGGKSLKQYWETIRAKYQAHALDLTTLSLAQADNLPANWTVVNISVTDDKSTMFISRQRANAEPLIFCVPLKGRRESDMDEHLTFDDALDEFRDIIRLSDESTRRAVHVTTDDQQARASWWAERSALDKRMQELLENIEFCWLGAFKTILSQPMKMPPDVITGLRAQFDRVFQNSLQTQEKKQKTRIRLDDTLLECFSNLSPKCRDEELEDLIYFILDLYQFHGVSVAIAEVDVVQVVVDLRIALEEHAVKAEGRVVPEEDSHTFLVLDKNVQGIPWESIPILRGRSVSRIPSMDFLVDRLQFVRWQKTGNVAEGVVDRAVVDPRKTYYVLNPSGDLGKTEGRFASWVKDMNKVGWKGLVGRPPSEQEFLDALSREDLVIYFGHGGGEQYVRSHKIRHLPRCAATMLWGCSSGALREMGDFDRVGTPHNYMLAGCPTLVANIWDVTDRDIDKFSQSVFEMMRMTASDVGQWRRAKTERGKVSLITAVAQSRDSCKLKYLTGAAPVVYGIPFYL